MRVRSFVLLYAGLIILASSIMASAVTEQVKQHICYYVAANGSDAWSGKLAEPNKAKTDGPFASLASARDAIRKLKSSTREPTTPIDVIVRGGTYHLKEPLVLKPEDSGSAQSPITYKAYPGEKPVISGGRTLGNWKLYRGKIWSCSVANIDTEKVPLRSLFYKDKPMELTRYPNFDPNNPYRGWMYTQPRPFPKSPSSLTEAFLPIIRKGWDTSPDAEFVIFMPDNLDWLTNVLPIRKIDKAMHLVTVGNEQKKSFWAFSSGRRCFIRNVFEELDSPGEWYLDKKNSKLYFWSPDSQKPKGSDVTLPCLDRIIDIQGDSKTNNYVDNINISGLTFRHTTAHEQGGVECPTDGAIRFAGARKCMVSDCKLLYLAANAITIDSGCSDLTVEGSEIAGTGSNGIYLLPGAVYTTPNSTMSNHHIIGNEFYDCSRLHKGTAAVQLWSTGGNLIEHNYFHDLPRWAIALVYTLEGNNIIRYNEMRHTCIETGDCGAIHTSRAGSAPEQINEIHHNLIVDTVGYATGLDGKPTPWNSQWGAIYLDGWASSYRVHDNVISGYQFGAVTVGLGHNNISENNIFNGGRMSQTYFAATGAYSDKFVRNIITYTSKDASVHRVNADDWKSGGNEFDYNLIFTNGMPLKTTFPGMKKDKDSWQDWIKLGFDKNSIIADPMFMDLAKEDFRLRPESPALKLGFRQIDLSGVGLNGYGK